MRSGAARIAAALASVVLLVVPANALAADAYVDDDAATNTPPCTAAEPCQSIQTGIFDAGVGDTIRVDGGTYNANVSLSDGKSLIEEEFNGGDGDSQATIDGGASVAITVPSGGSEVEIEGFTIQSDAVGIELNSAATVTGNLFDDPAANVHVNMLAGSTLSSVIGNTLTDTPGDTDDQIGVQYIAPGPGAATINGNTFENLSIALHVANGGASVSGNTITGTRASASNVGVGMQVVDGSATIVGNDIRSPDTPDITQGIAVAEAVGPNETTATLRRNEVYDQQTGVRTNDSEGAVTLNGDVIAGSTSAGIAAVDTVAGGDEGDVAATNVTAFDNATDVTLVETHIDLDSSLVGNAVNDFANGTCAIGFSRGPVIAPGGTGCDDFQTTAGPQFVNPAVNNYHLQAGSPMIDVGNPASPGSAQDLDGGPRAVDGNCDGIARRDIGADERATSCPGPPPAADTDPPETEITRAPRKKTRKRKASFEFSADEPGSSFECKLDKREFAPCSSTFKEKVKRRRHAFEVQATDDAGNTDPTPATHKWKVKRKRKRR